MTQKEKEFSFQVCGKENLPIRLRKLIGNRSARSAAAEWGLSFSTLNNYLNRGTDPSFSVMKTIATKENVSLDWLAFGVEESDRVHLGSKSSSNSSNEELEATWSMIYKTLNKEDLEALMGLLLTEGAKGVLALSAGKTQHKDVLHDSFTEVERTLLQLPIEEQERLIALHEAKKGASEEREVVGPKNPISGVVRANQDLEPAGSKVKKSAS
ncbi:helix-turn-helix transcriptional regulator [Salmonella enterica]|nr:helix-turn-helix transcriptional regulator [Salmonella enterica]ECE3077509.1 helix-turn-helix transcriptional regulator [Salmonella enterica]